MPFLWLIAFFNVLVLLGLWWFARLFLSGRDLSRFDTPGGGNPCGRSAPSSEHEQVLERVAEMRRATRSAPFGQRLAAARRHADRGFAGTPSDPEILGVECRRVLAGDVPAEWILAPGADPGRRLLYIHGGALMLGSPSSHRALTSALSHRAGVAVLSVDYRLMPEHPRLACVTDCRRSYRWMLDNGPDGVGAPTDVYVAGDSAGGNLSLTLSAWTRDSGLRAPEAVVALSPATDNTFQSPSLRSNRDSDVMLGPVLGRFLRLPLPVLAWITWLTTRRRPQDPVLSPLRGELSGLAPTLVQASDCEMLLDDGRRYVNKACAEGSEATLELWPGMVHVWQLFVDILPEAGEALDSATAFLQAHTNTRRSGG